MATFPIASNYPESFDNDENLYLVHDELRVRLAEDYNPGDSRIVIEDLNDVMQTFPETGLITLTEQCSDIDLRAISFYYTSKTDTSFEGLIKLPNFTDVIKPKKITNVTQNVMAEHHNTLKDALIAIQTFVGIEGTVDTLPFGDTLSGRIGFLTKLIFTPRAWFTVDRRIGLVPLTVTFNEQAFRVGPGEVTYIWNFGDDTVSNISFVPSTTISAISQVPSTSRNDFIDDLDGGLIKKTFTEPGEFDVSLTVINEYGQDTVVFQKLINARIEAPDKSVIDFIPRSTQNVTSGLPVGGPYTTVPTIRTRTNQFIDMQIPAGENPSTPGKSYSGELLDGSGNPIDPITQYTWNLADDLDQANSRINRASYSQGGYYDLSVRVDTSFGSYRITSYENAIDVIESTNLWMFNLSNTNSVGGGTLKSYEFGLLSETFKSLSNQTLSISRDNSFLDYLSNTTYYTDDAEANAKREFSKNVLFAPQGTTTSGNHGNSILFWASGGSSVANQTIDITQYNGFEDTYNSQTSISNRPWNWAALNEGTEIYFLFGTSEDTASSNTNPARPIRTDYSLQTLTAGSNTTLTSGDFENGADDLLDHPSIYESGKPSNGYFAVYRTAWKDNTGYIVRNVAVNEFFRLSEFYSTQGTLSNPFETLTRLPDVGGSAKTEGELVKMINGVFFFNNSGEVSAWNDNTMTWEVLRQSSSTISFRSLQDTNISEFDLLSNTLQASSDGDRIAYLSYDYSTNAFIKFNGTDNTFSSAGSRPIGEQFVMGIY